MDAAHGIKVGDMDLSADPGIDFFRYANGQWLDRTAIPPEYPRWGSFMILMDRELDRVHDLLQSAAANGQAGKNRNEKMIGDFYASGMDEEAIEKAGVTPLANEFARIARIRTVGQLADVVAHFHLAGPNVFFAIGSEQDAKNTEMVIAETKQAGLGLPDRDYYLKDDERSESLRAKYLEHVANMLVLLGDRPKDAKQAAQEIMAIETALAKVSMTKVEKRDPHLVYNKMSLSQWQELFPKFPVKRYMAQIGLEKVTSLNVAQPNFFKGLNEVLATVPMAQIKKYLRWHLIRSTAGCLSSAFVNEAFDFFSKTLMGVKELQPRWKRVVNRVSGMLGDAVGEVYVRLYFPPEAKARALELVANVTAEVRAAITAMSWMSESTGQNALLKLSTFKTKIGYPDKWIDYRKLKINRGSYVGNVLSATLFLSKRELAHIDKPVDRTRWYMSPQMVNAYYDPSSNEIAFPAAILQPPFFDFQADDACNYGGIGAVIAHEITHGFDDKGSKFDHQGNLNDWWTEEDRNEFDRRMGLIKSQYSGFKVDTGDNLDGDLVCGEAAADLGGAKLAYRALQRALAGKPVEKIDGFTPVQRFFIAYAQIWAGKSTPEYQRKQVMEDPHPPGRFRTNGTVAHIPEFADAFSLAADAPIMLSADKRCELW